MEAKLSAEADDEKAEELANEPIVVTANDVYAGLKARAKEQAKRQAEQLAKYKEVKAKVIPERLFRNIAIERIIGKDYHNLKKRHQRILEELKPMEKKYIELKDVPYKQKKEFYLSYSDKLRQKQAMEKQLKDYNEELRNKEDDIQRIVDELTQQNKAIQEDAKKIYGEVIKAKNKEKMYLAKATELKENVPDSDRILYSRQLPRLVMRHSKLEGGKPLKDFQILSHNGRAYVVLSDIPTGKLEPQKKTALLLGDTVEKGQASVYTLTMGPNGKEILDVSRTKDTVRLYGSAKKTILKRGEGNHYPPHTEAVHQQRQTEVLGKINHFLEKAVEDTHGRYQAWWDDEDHHKKKDGSRCRPETDRSPGCRQNRRLPCPGRDQCYPAKANGIDLTVVGVYSRAPEAFMIMTKDPSIQSVKDLKGKKIAGPKGTISNSCSRIGAKKDERR